MYYVQYAPRNLLVKQLLRPMHWYAKIVFHLMQQLRLRLLYDQYCYKVLALLNSNQKSDSAFSTLMIFYFEAQILASILPITYEQLSFLQFLEGNSFQSPRKMINEERSHQLSILLPNQFLHIRNHLQAYKPFPKQV